MTMIATTTRDDGQCWALLATMMTMTMLTATATLMAMAPRLAQLL